MKTGPKFRDILEYWFVWMVVTGVAWTVSSFVLLLVMSLSGGNVNEWIGIIIGGLLGGALIGLAQQIYLGPGIADVRAWLSASAVGWAIGAGLAVWLSGQLQDPFGQMMGGIAGGLLFGVGQTLAMKPSGGRRRRWVIFNMFGWMLVTLAGSALQPEQLASARAVSETLSVWAVGSVILSLLSILIVVVFFPQRIERNADRPERWWW